jgi:TetR/AcrR family transcriptional regulator
MARPRAATYDEQREQILAAAAAAFAHRGFTATTMNDIAAASGVSKATLYHYFADKHALLATVARDHVARLEALVADVAAQRLRPQAHLRELIRRFMQAYTGAQHAHRVLTEDVKFMDAAARRAVQAGQRRVVQAYADAVAAVRPDLTPALRKPLAMLLFGMINWTFTWMKTGGALTHEALGDVVADLYFGGVGAVRRAAGAQAATPAAAPARRAGRAQRRGPVLGA